MVKKSEEVLKEVLLRIEPGENELNKIKIFLRDFISKLNKKIATAKIDTEVFVGGSFAKSTLIKKDKYDIDIFLRFNKKYSEEEISKLAKKILDSFKEVSVIHGSRDYFKIETGENFFIEIIPVMKIEKPKDSNNVTDLSYSHVKYINKKINSRKLRQEIMIAKEFCYACKSYGAESYIKGFSGYSIELLIVKYKSFMNMIKNLSKADDKLVIDIEKNYKNKNELMMDMNSSKTGSPIILVDPTFPQRNALAGLSQETFDRFKEQCKKFLKNPTKELFEVKKTDLEKVKLNAEKKKFDFILLEAKTGKQEGDIAGSKLLKFYNYLTKEISRYFEIKDKGFNYNGKKSARYFFVAKKKENQIFSGPFADDKKNVVNFMKEHKNIFEKNKRIYAREPINFNLEKFIENWKKKNSKQIKDMKISEIKRVN